MTFDLWPLTLCCSIHWGHRIQMVLLTCLLVFSQSVRADNSVFTLTGDIATRLDNKESQDVKEQYRVRLKPKYSILASANRTWTVHALVMTGDDFGSSYNLYDESDSHPFHIRRLYLSRESKNTKLQLGVIPTYKGRVSSTGLSKDGWIKGIRYVRKHFSAQYELVIGELNDTNPEHIFSDIGSLDYIELEYSSRSRNGFTTEFGYQKAYKQNYLRAEFRKQWPNISSSIEWLHNVDKEESKSVLSAELSHQVFSANAESALFLTKVDEKFGQVAELTEDFLEFGNALALESKVQPWPQQPLKFFVKYEKTENRYRTKLGLEYKF